MQKINGISLKRIIFILPLFIFFGCGLWGNFTTYFNLYYNTSDDFNEAERLIKEQKVELFSTEDPAIPGSATQLINKVIEKASKILQFHSQTAYVDDALLMLGKSFYYQKNYPKALRKFEELLATQSNSDLKLEDSLWIGKCQMRVKNYEAALKTLADVRRSSISEGEETIFEEAFIEEIKYRIILEDYSQAISLINQFLQLPGNNETKAKVSYELGNLYEKTNDLKSALVAYEKVPGYSSEFDVVLKSRISLAAAHRKNGNAEKSLEILEDLKSEVKYTELFHKIDLETGLSHLALNKISEAIETFTRVDTGYPGSLSNGAAKYELGKLYENQIPNFDSAAAYYQKASTSSAEPEVIIAATDKATKFKKYLYIRSLIEDNKRQLSYILDTAKFAQDSIAYAADTAKLAQELALLRLDNEDIIEGGDPRNERGLQQQNNPLIPPKAVRKAPVRPTISSDSLSKLIVKSEFDMAGLFFNEIKRPDSARYYYTDILTNYPNTNYTGRTLYALAAYYKSVGQDSVADSLYNIVYENYKNESLGNAAAVILKKKVTDLNYDPAKELYVDAERKMNNDSLYQSLTGFYDIYYKYPKSPHAPKALYAAGWLLENKLKLNDSAAVVYDSVLAKFPSSEYANAVRPKVTFYKQELQRKEQERLAEQNKLKTVQDSLTNTTSPVDSLTGEPIEKENVVTDETLTFPQNPVTPQDSLKLKHSMTIDSLRRQDPRYGAPPKSDTTKVIYPEK